MAGDGWSEDAEKNLSLLWEKTVVVQTAFGPKIKPAHSTSAIGELLGYTKNAVVGKAHRLGLESRPSPIIRGKSEPVAGPRRNLPPPRVTLPPLTHTLIAPPTVCRPRPPHPPHPDIIPSEPGPSQSQAILPVEALPPRQPVPPRTCLWPIGQPGTKAFRFCESPAASGKSYCQDHCELAYVRKEKATA